LGKVFLVGAGPGESWLTPACVFGILRSADVVLYDKLIDASLLNSAPSDAELIYVGKAPGKHSLSQEEINKLLEEKARKANVVVRLKGGDPFVLGRGDEECDYLVSKGIECRVVPAPSSATAVPACAGIPVTRRGLANTFAVATGRAAEGSKTPRYGSILSVVDTLVVLMGVGKVDEITSSILGEVGDVPAAAISNGCTRSQRAILTWASKLPGFMKEEGIEPPAVLVFGKVVKWAWERGLVKGARVRF